jgi:hypothetical protein
VAKKITDYDYTLPIIESLGADKTTDNQLLICGINPETLIKGDYIVNNNQVAGRELLASFMASELDINVPSPALINVSSELSKTFQNDVSSLQFGTEYKVGYYGIIRNQPLSEFQRLQINQIFPFDIFISNVARRTEHPNLLTDGNNLLIFNHQSAFDFLNDGYKNKTPWEFRPQDKDWIKSHVFFPYLKNKFPDFSILINKLERLDDNFWNKAFSLIPEEWKTDELEEIKSHSQAIIANKNTFLQSLKNVLFK